MEERRFFTIAEASSVIPVLEEHFEKIRKEQVVIVSDRDEIKKASSKADLGGGSTCGSRYIQALEQISHHIDQIHENGVVVKDLETGLCDFPHMMDGRLVYLCWKLGEPDIRWWHETDAGFAGRQPLRNEQGEDR